MVVYGMDKLDEISACGETKVAEVRGNDIKYYTIKPEDFGFERVPKEALAGGTPEENAEITKAILRGEGTSAQKLPLHSMPAHAFMLTAMEFRSKTQLRRHRGLWHPARVWMFSTALSKLQTSSKRR